MAIGIDTSTRKPRRARGTPLNKYQNIFALAVLGVGAVFAVAFHYSSYSHPKFREYINNYLYTESLSDVEKRTRVGLVTPRSSTLLQQVMEEEQRVDLPHNTRKATNEKSKNENTKFNQAQSKLSQFFENPLDISVDRRTPSKDTPPPETSSKYFQQSNDKETNESILDFRTENNKRLQSKLKHPRKNKKTKTKKSTSNKKENLLRFTKNFEDVCTLGGIDVNPEHLQLAIALSLSLADGKENKTSQEGNSDEYVSPTPSTSQYNSNEEENVKRIRKTLDQYGFKVPSCPIMLPSSRKILMERKLSKSLIFIRSLEEKKQIVSNAISQILFESQIDTSENRRVETELYSSLLHNLRSKQNYLYSKSAFSYSDMEDELDVFYVRNMLTPSESKVGCLLKDWSKIPGRDPSPERESKNSDLADNNLFPEHLDVLLSSSCSYIIDKISGIKNKSMSPEKRSPRSRTATPKKRSGNENLELSMPNYNSNPENSSKTERLDESSTNRLYTQERRTNENKTLYPESNNLETKLSQKRSTSPVINTSKKESDDCSQNKLEINTVSINIQNNNDEISDHISEMNDKSDSNCEKLTVIEIKSRSCSPDLFEDDSDCEDSFRKNKLASADLPPKVIDESSDDELPDVFVSMSQNHRNFNTPKTSQVIEEAKLDDSQVIDLVDIDYCPRSSFNKIGTRGSLQSSVDLTEEEDIVKDCEENNVCFEVNSKPLENNKLSHSSSNNETENFIFKSPSKISSIDIMFQKDIDEIKIIDSFVESRNKTVCSLDSDESVVDDCLRKKRLVKMSFGSIDDSVAFNEVLKDFKVNEKNNRELRSESSMESIDLTSENVCETNFDVSHCRSFSQMYENDNGVLHFESYHEADGPLDISDEGSPVKDPTELCKNAKNVNDISASILDSENNVSTLSDDNIFDNSQPYNDHETFNPTKPSDVCNDTKIDLTQSPNSFHSFDTQNHEIDSFHQTESDIKNSSVSENLNDEVFYISDEEFNYSINTSRYKKDKQNHKNISMSADDLDKPHSSIKRVNIDTNNRFAEKTSRDLDADINYSDYKKDKQNCNDISMSEDEHEIPHSSKQKVRTSLNEKFIVKPVSELRDEFNYSINTSYNKEVKRNCNDISVSQDEHELSCSIVKKGSPYTNEIFVKKHDRELDTDFNYSYCNEDISVFKDWQENPHSSIKKTIPIIELDEEINTSYNKKDKRNYNDISMSEDEQEIPDSSIKNIRANAEVIFVDKPDTEVNKSNDLDFEKNMQYRISNRFDLYGSSLFDQIPSYHASLVDTPKFHDKKETSIVLDDNKDINASEDLPDVYIKKVTNVHLRNAEKKSIETPPNNKFVIKTDNVTPAQDYNKMDTPKIHKELAKFGLKPLKRKRAVKLLQHIYDETHPLVDSNELEMKLKRRKLQNEPIPKSPVQIESNYRGEDCDYNVDDLCDRLVGTSPQTSQNYNNECERVVNSDIYAPDCKTVVIKSIDCNAEDWIFQTREKSKIHGCRVPLHIAFHNYLSVRSRLRAAILRYEPVNIDTIHKGLVADGYRYNSKDLFQFMDKKCITIKTTDKTGGSRQKKQ